VVVEVAALGELRVGVDGTAITPPAPKERALLALLAIDAGRVVPTDRLLEELWPDLPPDRGRHVLQVRIAEIRKPLGRAGAADVLASAPAGYRLDVGADTLDSARFAALVQEGRARLAAGDPGAAADTLRAALGLWRGAAFAGVRGSAAVEAEAARLQELRLGAIEARTAAELADGCHQQLVRSSMRWWPPIPSVRLCGEQRVVALYRSGRQAEALRACAASGCATSWVSNPAPAYAS
jgi:DNA-binding SARP family transcriptional activator